MIRAVKPCVFASVLLMGFAGADARAAENKRRKQPPPHVSTPEEDLRIGREWLAAHPEVPNPWAVPTPIPMLPTVKALPPGAAAPDSPPEGVATDASAPAAQPATRPPAAPRESDAAARAPASRARTPAPDAVRTNPASVYRLDPAIDAVVIAAGALGSALPWIFQDKLIRPRGLGNPADLNSLDRSVVGNHVAGMALASNLTTAAALALPVIVDLADVGWSRELFEDGVVMTEVLAMSGLGVSYARYTTQRRSPQLYLASNAAAASNTSLYRSFVSWQTATTFASLSALSFTLSQRHDLNVLPWIGTALIGGSVAAERIASGGAFYTDVIGGALVGIAAGTVVPWLHLRTNSTWTVLPAPGGVQVGGVGRF